MKWVAKLTREFTTLYHRLPSIRRANEDNRHQFAFPSYTSFNFFFVFDDHVLLYAPNNKSIKATAHRSATFNLGSGTRDTLHDAVHTRSISFSFVLLAVNYRISLLSRLFAGNFVAAPSQPTSRRLQKSHTAPRVSLSLPFRSSVVATRGRPCSVRRKRVNGICRIYLYDFRFFRLLLQSPIPRDTNDE